MGDPAENITNTKNRSFWRRAHAQKRYEPIKKYEVACEKGEDVAERVEETITRWMTVESGIETHARWHEWFKVVAEQTERTAAKRDNTNKSKVQRRCMPKRWRGGMQTPKDMRKYACAQCEGQKIKWKRPKQVEAEVQKHNPRPWRTESSG